MATTYDVQQSEIDLREKQYEDNRKAWEPVLMRFEDALQTVSGEGAEQYQQRHQSRGQLLRKFQSYLINLIYFCRLHI